MTALKIIITLTLWVTSFAFNSSASAAEPGHKNLKLYVKVYYKEAKALDTISLSVDNLVNFSLEQYSITFQATNKKNSYFQFEIPLKSPSGYFCILKPRTFTDNGEKQLRQLIEPYFYEAGDSITINLSSPETFTGISSDATVTGRGATKYIVKNQLKSIKVNIGHQIRIPSYPFGFDGNILKFKDFDAISDYNQRRLDLLRSYKLKLSPLVHDVLRADILYENQTGILLQIAQYGRDSLWNKSEPFKSEFQRRFARIYGHENNRVSAKALSSSLEYTKFLFTKMRVASSVYTGMKSEEYTYKMMRSMPGINSNQQMLKDNLILLLFLVTERQSDSSVELYMDALTQVKNPLYLQLIEQLKLRAPGRDLSHFVLEDMNGSKVQLADFRGKVSLLDFWFTGCGHCEVYYKNVLSEVKHYFKGSSQINFISISSDVYRDKWKQSIESGAYTSNDAINLFTGGLGMKHPIVKDNQIWGFPCVLLLDKNGRILKFNTQDLYDKTTLIALLQKKQI
ncbi:MAG: TlpA disulfide reductase family protein [Bacteroidota bacterium]